MAWIKRVRLSRGVVRASIGVLFGALLLLPVPVRAGREEGLMVLPRAESWYRPLPGIPSGLPDVCDLPIGCLPEAPAPPAQPPSPYASGTLHVGVRLGIEDSRTYLALDLSEVPADAELTGGTMTLPIATDPTAGTVLADTAKIRACLGPVFVPDGIDGNITGAPAPDCTIMSPATYVAASGEQPPALVIDLGPFVGKWSGGVAPLAILPQDGLLPTEQWHVAFHRRDADTPGAVPISARLVVATGDELDVPPPLTGNRGTSSFVPDSFAAPPFDVDEVALPVTPDPAAEAPLATPPASIHPVASVLDGRFAYPGVFVLPFLFGGVVAWAGRAFTRDLHRAPPELGSSTSWGFPA